MFTRAPTLAALLALAGCSANDDVPAPSISAVLPDHGTPGSVVTVTGAGLCQQPRGSSDDDPFACAHVGVVLFGVAPATATAYTDAIVMVEVPPVATGRSSVMVVVAGRSSNSLDFTVE
jgi:hypothetical protein